MKQVLKALSLLIEMKDTSLDSFDIFEIGAQHFKIVESLSVQERETYNKMAQAYFEIQEKAFNPDSIVVAPAYNAAHLIDFLESSDGPVFGGMDEIAYIKNNVSEDGYIDGSHVKNIFIRLYGYTTAQKEIRLMECNVVTAM